VNKDKQVQQKKQSQDHQHASDALLLAPRTLKGCIFDNALTAAVAALSKAGPWSSMKGYSRLMWGGHLTKLLSLKHLML
jgi:hypothetical protein